MFLRRPLFINQLTPDVSTSLARLAGIDGLSRSILVGVIPLIALQAFGSKDVIASVYFASTLFTLLFTLNLSRLERLLQRRWLLTVGGVFVIASVIFFSVGFGPLFAIGIGIRAAGASIFSVCLSLYVMDFISKQELTLNESRRLFYVGIAWLLGPALGGWMFESNYLVLLYSISAISAVMMLLYFWRLRLTDHKVLRSALSQTKSPMRAVIRFMSQPYLRIAYLITLSRSCFWVAVFVYGPIYAIEAGLPAWVGGVLLSGVSSLALLSPLVRKIADRFGTRQVLIACSITIGINLVALGIVGEPKPIGFAFLVIGSFGGVGMDVLVNIPFMRLVKPRERIEMTPVFTTWRENASLLTQGIAFLVLLVAPFWVFYIVIGGLQLVAAFGATYLPKRL